MIKILKYFDRLPELDKDKKMSSHESAHVCVMDWSSVIFLLLVPGHLNQYFVPSEGIDLFFYKDIFKSHTSLQRRSGISQLNIWDRFADDLIVDDNAI